MTSGLVARSLGRADPSETHLSYKILKLRADATSFGVRKHTSRRSQVQLDLSLAESRFPLVGVISSAAYQQQESPFYNENLFLLQMFEDVQALDKVLRTSAAAIACRIFVAGPGLLLAHQPHTRCAVFPDENGSVTLIAHSGELRRQLALEFCSDGITLDIVKIDEHMQRTTRSSTVRDLGALRTAMAWLGSC